ncbi:hypothetical protein [Algoriphagus halophytocola]|uniref:DUF4382 domain-containing protein n=1 Tax=Algoriphagus halophytocola TaxID=2991499 RepID=A0ABY6MC05_9BACT|nr:hypothetical protein [Algoriphagus sp. TR-M5]UZD21167.1 hypothetical protein OM944_10825 [Algoriphagus sp. TR-M5]
MKKLNYLLLFVFAGLAFACSSEDEGPKLVEKNVTIEVEMGGNYSDYLVTFSVHSMLAGTSTFVAPILNEPSSLDWTQVVEQGNTYTLTLEPEVSTIMAKSSAPIHSLGFVFNAVHLGGETDDSFQSLKADVRVLANGSVFKEYSYEALDPGEVSVPLGEEITLN